MKRDNSSYTVTSPDLMLTESGMSVLISCNDQEVVDEIKLLIEQFINATSIVFYVQNKPTTDTSLAWLYHATMSSDLCIIDADNCAWIDILTTALNAKGLVIYYSPKNKKRDALKVLHASAKYPIIHSREDLKEYITAEFNADRNY